jgi:hypothetical protein
MPHGRTARSEATIDGNRRSTLAGPFALGNWRFVKSRSGTLQESHVESPKYQHYCDVYDQPNPEVVSQEQDVHADDDDYERDHVKHNGQVLSHALLRITLIRDTLGFRGAAVYQRA